MSRHKMQRKGHVAVAQQKGGPLIAGQGTEETHEYDDSPLPTAEELEKLNAINPDIVPWLMKRAEEEQKFRHESVRKRDEVLGSVFLGETHINKSAIHWAGAIILVGISLSAFLIYNQQTIAGSIFGGVALVSCATIFVGRSRGADKEQRQNATTDVQERNK